MDQLWKAYLNGRSIEDRDALVNAIRQEVFGRVFGKWGCRIPGDVQCEVDYQVVVAVSGASEPIDVTKLASKCQTAVSGQVRAADKEQQKLRKLTERFGTADTSRWC
jgi:hypothetical protein